MINDKLCKLVKFIFVTGWKKKNDRVEHKNHRIKQNEEKQKQKKLEERKKKPFLFVLVHHFGDDRSIKRYGHLCFFILYFFVSNAVTLLYEICIHLFCFSVWCEQFCRCRCRLSGLLWFGFSFLTKMRVYLHTSTRRSNDCWKKEHSSEWQKGIANNSITETKN